MVSSAAYASWLSQREHKISKPLARSSLSHNSPSIPPASKSQSKADTTQQLYNDYKTAPSVLISTKMETPRKRPHEIGATASKLATLRSIKRRRDDASNVNSTCRAMTRATSSEQQNQSSNCPVLLEESNYWLTVQKFSQF
ncbi:hypothetical protein V7S43_008684 [Phytophthora oleae]|uniref:Uncharacterized protein n=1 Tax=Phytophthora oleae TaxID=2107226 RepID=A0ABD3FJE1_9STRA